MRYEPQKPARTKLTATDRTDEVVVKFREGSRVRLRGGKLDPAAAADIAPHTSSSQAMQNYMWDAPRGISASRAWARPGAGGNGLWFADIETGWRTDHEDFPNYIWRRGWNVGDVDHGTASVGVTSAPPNPYGVSGISAWATVNLYGIVQAIRPWAPSGTINLAASHLIPGDVMLIEQHIPGPDVGPCPPTFCNCSPWGFIPVEWNQAEFDAIRSATARGIVVVEPAGNGGQNLDDPRYLNRFNLGVRDSEAVMVGAINSGEPGSGASFGGTSCFSDFGSRVDVSAWGDSVVTLGYGTASGTRPGFVARVNGDDARQGYTDRFAGTSSASAIVAGAALGVNSALLTAGRTMESSLSMLLLFQSTGTFVGTASRPVGRQPNMDAALISRGL